MLVLVVRTIRMVVVTRLLPLDWTLCSSRLGLLWARLGD